MRAEHISLKVVTSNTRHNIIRALITMIVIVFFKKPILTILLTIRYLRQGA